uniref:DUF5683 domain-containing protein n=1 Tax=Eiseniibacteriota bacterium TaxID=2212470 RepID=A0A832ML05_UNCEI
MGRCARCRPATNAALALALAALTALAPAAARGAATARAPFEVAAPGARAEPPAPPAMASALALPALDPDAVPAAAAPQDAARPAGLGAERAMILLRSLTVPGWGQATLGRPRTAAVFLLAEAGVWGAFTAFRIQERMRRESYERTALLAAGIDMRGRDEEFRRIVGSFLSSEEYNLYVVARDAANLYYDNPDSMRAYIERNSLSGDDAWAWSDLEGIQRYRRQRQDAQRAEKRANTALAVAVLNRILSAAHAARLAGHSPPAPGWSLEVTPPTVADPTSCRVALSRRF